MTMEKKREAHTWRTHQQNKRVSQKNVVVVSSFVTCGINETKSAAAATTTSNNKMTAARALELERPASTTHSTKACFHGMAQHKIV